jgi:hypothetical protein
MSTPGFSLEQLMEVSYVRQRLSAAVVQRDTTRPFFRLDLGNELVNDRPQALTSLWRLLISFLP